MGAVLSFLTFFLEVVDGGCRLALTRWRDVLLVVVLVVVVVAAVVFTVLSFVLIDMCKSGGARGVRSMPPPPLCCDCSRSKRVGRYESIADPASPYHK